MRSLIFGAILVAATAAGFHTLISISSSTAAARSAATTFSERFAPVLDQMKNPAGASAGKFG
jgi:hypothetical protein